MKTSKKMYKRCPYEAYGFRSCRECPKYEMCVRRKNAQIKNRRRRNVNGLSQLIAGIAVFLVCAVVLSMILGIFSSITSFAGETPVEGDGVVAEPSEGINREIQKEEIKPNEESNPNEDVQAEIEIVTKIPADFTFVSATEPSVKIEEILEVNAFGAHSEYIYNISYEDMVYIAKVVWAEARGECLEGKVAVAAVILNRYFSGLSLFKTDSIYSVVTQENQFASIKYVTMEDLKEYPECMEAVDMACRGWDPTRAVFEDGALYFYNPEGVSGYQARIRENITVMTIGKHNFHVDFNLDAVE